MTVARLNTDPVSGGFYTIREAARLLRMDNPRRVYNWITGSSRGSARPVIKRQYPPLNQKQEIGFLDLMELRFIDHFRRQRVSLQSLRKAAATARDVLQREHPFALSNIKFMTDRKEVFLHAARETEDMILLNLMTNQIEIYEALEQVLAKGVDFDLRSGIARRWLPLQNDCPNVIIDPRIAYGQPVVAPGYVPTRALFSLWTAENGDYRSVADWFGISQESVEEAVEFEVRLAA